MKIQGRKQPIGAMGPISLPAAAEPAASPESAMPTPGDQVDLDSTGLIRKLAQAAQALPSVRTEKVEELRDAIEDGSYHVESEKLARKVVDDVLTEALMSQLPQKAL